MLLKAQGIWDTARSDSSRMLQGVWLQGAAVVYVQRGQRDDLLRLPVRAFPARQAGQFWPGGAAPAAHAAGARCHIQGPQNPARLLPYTKMLRSRTSRAARLVGPFLVPFQSVPSPVVSRDLQVNMRTNFAPTASLMNLVVKMLYACKSYRYSLQNSSSQASVQVAGGQEAKIGIVHNFLHYRPKHPDGPSNIYIGRLCKLMERIWATDIMLEYFTTGRFRWSMPYGSLTHQDQEKPGLDWIGMNYYGRHVLLDTCHSITWLGG